MPVTKTAKRALRGSKNKTTVNKLLVNKLEIAVRHAKKSKKHEEIKLATSLADRAAKKNIIHKNKAARIKSQLSKLESQKTSKKEPVKAPKKVSAKKK
jgi:small subunit ribosomal protein S20